MDIDLNAVSRPQSSSFRPLLESAPENDAILCIDNTTLEKFMTCPRSAEYYCVNRREAPKRAALDFGQAIHSGLEAWYRTGSEEIAVNKTFEAAQNIALAAGEWRTPDRAVETIQRYVRQYPNELWRVLYSEGNPLIEMPFSLPLGSIALNCSLPYPAAQLFGSADPREDTHIRNLLVFWTGRIDLFAEDHEGPFILDHKTTSITGPTYWKSFEHSSQLAGYQWAASKLLGQPIRRAVINAIIGRQPTRTGTNIDFDRQTYYIDEWRSAEWIADTMRSVTDFVVHLRRGHFPGFTTWCVGKFGACQYFDVCSMPPNQRSLMLNTSDYANVTWNPLD